jgi:hypothetical protein
VPPRACPRAAAARSYRTLVATSYANRSGLREFGVLGADELIWTATVTPLSGKCASSV